VINGEIIAQIQRVYHLLDDYKLAFGDYSLANSGTPYRFVKWLPPALGYWKLNVDGDSLGNPEGADCGGVIRGSLGNWKAEFSVYFGHTANPAAELWGIWQGIRLAIDKD
jgi:hypothetical protein